MMRYMPTDQISKSTISTQSSRTVNTIASDNFHIIMDQHLRIPTTINNHAMTVKTVHSLEAELIRLRESTKDALQQSWEEVESLQQQCSAHLDITTQLENDVIEARRKQEYWHKRCLDAEFKLLQQQGGKHSSGSSVKSNQSSLYKNMTSGSANVLKPMMSNLPAWTGIKKEKSDELSSQMSSMMEDDETTEVLQEKNEEQSIRIQELERKLEDREASIDSLERTVERHVKTMHSLQAEMQCMMETQRLKEKKCKETYSRKQTFLEDQITNLEQDVQCKDSSIKSLKRKSQGYKKYIEELSSEMETVLAVLMKAEKNGVNLHQLGR